jgi:hypothetical protein
VTRLISILCLFAIVGAASADYTLGSDGYYYQGGQAYTRSPYSYYYCGRYYTAYSYTPYYPPAAPKKVTYTDPDWRTKLLDLAAERDKAELKVRQGVFEQQYFLQAVKELGLNGNFRIEGYGQAPPYQPSGPSYVQSHVGYQAGSTVYGMATYNTLAQVYGQESVGQLLQTYARLTENQQNLGGRATQDMAQLIGQEGTYRNKVAEILAKGEAVRQMLKALEEQSATLKTQVQVPVPLNGQPDPVQQPQQAPQSNLRKLFEESASKRCLSCHSGQKKEGGFDVTEFAALGFERQMKVIERMTTTNTDKLMPRSPQGGPGERVPQLELQAWMSQMAQKMPSAKE